jgi:hypothetical protein
MIDFAGDFALLRTEGQNAKEDGMKLKTKIRAGKIRPNHNVTLHGTIASSFATGRIAAQAAETAEVGTPAASTRGGRCKFCGRLPKHGRRSRSTGFWSDIIATPGGQNFMRLLRGKENPMKLQTRIKAGRPNPNHNTIVR